MICLPYSPLLLHNCLAPFQLLDLSIEANVSFDLLDGFLLNESLDISPIKPILSYMNLSRIAIICL